MYLKQGMCLCIKNTNTKVRLKGSEFNGINDNSKNEERLTLNLEPYMK